jgi:C-terminal processing protease CtpA/Prc
LGKNSPIFVEWLKPGDLIIAVNGISYSQMKEGEFHLRVEGPVGSKVKLTTIHECTPAPTLIEVNRVNLAELNY